MSQTNVCDTCGSARPASQKRMAPSRWTRSATPCGPRASTTRPTSTTISLPVYATTGPDSSSGDKPRSLRGRAERTWIYWDLIVLSEATGPILPL